MAETLASGNCGTNGDNLTWALDDNGVLTIKGSGDMQDYSPSDDGIVAPWFGSATSVMIEDGVTSIDKRTLLVSQ